LISALSRLLNAGQSPVVVARPGAEVEIGGS
jgi:hypothetical protein